MILCDREVEALLDQKRIVIDPRPEATFMDSTALGVLVGVDRSVAVEGVLGVVVASNEVLVAANSSVLAVHHPPCPSWPAARAACALRRT